MFQSKCLAMHEPFFCGLFWFSHLDKEPVQMSQHLLMLGIFTDTLLFSRGIYWETESRP